MDITPKPDRKQIKYQETFKFNKWCNYFMDKNNKETYGNATQSAIKAYNYDPITQYAVASTTGAYNLKKQKSMGMAYGENKGLGLYQLIDWAISQMFKTGDTKWFEIVRDMLGYAAEKEPTTQVNIPIQINNLLEDDKEKYK